ncbi:acyl-CoA Delta-9 desaturase [Papilio machaon]|uniref:acyl-CoA Delta-9 desaturase n=1 Tax=Papilio machaon TaxID=76193 RepID=UPI001E665005|nr:acyl-CoA Delta-9 desaturase [Papilio machaon]
MTEVKNETSKGGPMDELSKLSKSREADWPAVLFFIHIHLLSIYGIWLLFFEVKWMTVLLLIALTSLATLAVNTGAHRLWAHRTYTATKELRFVLMLLHTLVGQGSIYSWVQYHRLHHALFETDVDPYDHKKGFFYAHMLTRLKKLSPYQEKLKEQIDMSDIEKDSIVMFQKNFYWLLYAVLFLLLPLNAPLEYWNDSVMSAVFVMGFLRYALVLHAAWLVESGFCIWGLKENDKYPSDSNLVFFLNQSFWPHYHYLIPRDYKLGEYGTYDSGCSTAFIRVWAALRLAKDLRTIDSTTVHAALAEAIKTKKPLKLCLQEATKVQHLPEDHYLK